MAAPLDRYLALLPQKPPSLFLDHVLELDHGRSAAGTKTFPPEHPIFAGHLPGRPLVPGVIVIEALAQLSGLVLLPAGSERPLFGLLADVGRLRFRRTVGPGEELLLRSSLERRLDSAARFSVSAAVAGAPVAEGEITLGGLAGESPAGSDT